MKTSRSRIALGCLLAAAVGTFGPISRAVSMESRRLVDVRGPGAPTLFEQLYHSAGRGAVANMQGDSPGTVSLELRVDESYVVRGGTRWHESRIAVDELPRAALVVQHCDDNACIEQRYQGRGAFTITDAERSFTATLDGANGSCTVSATWHVDPRLNLQVTDTWFGVGRKAPANGSAEASCAGSFTWSADEGYVYDRFGEYTWPR